MSKIFFKLFNLIRIEGFREEKNILKLRESDIISEDIYIEKDKFVTKNQIKTLAKFHKRGEKPLIEKMASGLTKSQIDTLRKLYHKGKIEKISVTESHTFAISILFGLIISFLVGDLVAVIQNG
jgi:hypothetical protein